ncbi:DUF1187 family protein, partial [Shigella sonnei]|nr:DUF1187 family protein [Escherichia coli]MWR77364.1 DUF1187 family protein [Escherichia coli]
KVKLINFNCEKLQSS